MSVINNTQFGRVGAFKFWCQKVLPAVYDDSLSYYELLCKLYDWLNELTELTNTQSDAITELQTTLAEFMAGTFDPYIEEKVDEWFEAHEPTLSNDVETLKTQMQGVLDNLEILNDMEGFAQAKYEVFTDLSAYGGGNSGDVWSYFEEIFNQSTMDMTVHNAPIDTGWVSQNESNQDADDYLVSIASTQTEAYRNSVDYVILNFGFYDIVNSSSGDYEVAGRTIVNRASNYYPNAIIVVNPVSNNYCYGYNRTMQLNLYGLNYGMIRSQVPVRIVPWYLAFNVNQLQPNHYYDTQADNPSVLYSGGVNSVGAMIKCALIGCENAYERETRSNLTNYLDHDYFVAYLAEFRFDVETMHVGLSAGSIEAQQAISDYETVVGEINRSYWTVYYDTILAICIQNTGTAPQIKGFLVLGADNKIYLRLNDGATINNGNILRLMPCASYEPAFRKIS